MWEEVLKPYQVHLSEDQYKLYYAGVPTGANALDIVKRFDLQVSPSVLASAKNAATRKFLSKNAFPLMAGVQESIAFFRSRGLKLAIVTGAGRFGVDATIRAHALDNCFATIVSGDDVRNSKPAPDCYLLAMQHLALNPGECIAIEDTEHGVAAASSAGVTCLAVPTSMSEHHCFASAAGIFRGLREAAHWVESYFPSSMKANPALKRTVPGKPGPAA